MRIIKIPIEGNKPLIMPLEELEEVEEPIHIKNKDDWEKAVELVENVGTVNAKIDTKLIRITPFGVITL